MGVRGRRIRSREQREPMGGLRSVPGAAGGRPAAPNHIAGMLLQMQRTAGNAAVNAFLQRQALTQAPAEGGAVGAGRSGVTVQRNGVKDLIEQHKKAQEESGKSRTGGGSTTAPVRSNLATKIEKFNAAKDKHTADRAALKKHVERGLAMGRDKENRLVNSCEWVMKGKTKLYAITPTGDSTERLTAAGKNPAKDEAFFPRGSGGPGDIFSSQEEYNYRDITDNTGIILDDDGKVTSGWNNAGYVAVANAQTVTQDYVWETLRHEVQHDSDQNRDKEVAAPNANLKNLEGYKTEYRAYNYEQGKYDKLSHTVAVTKYGYTWTQKQLAIFEDVFDGYEHTSDGWGKSTSGKPVTKATPKGKGSTLARRQARKVFQEAVIAYVNPDTEGFNKYNSVRVDDFYLKLKAIPLGTSSRSNPAVKALIKTCFTDDATKLNLRDATYILTESPDFTTKIAAHLSSRALAKVRGLLAAVS
jgi:hypothetical protein